MANPLLKGIPLEEQERLYAKLDAYNRGRASYKEAGAFLVVLPRAGCPQHTLWIYSPLPGRQPIFFLCNLAPGIHESLRMASTMCYYSPRSLYLVEYNARRMQSRGDDLVPFGKYRGHYLHEVLAIDPPYLSWIAYKYTPRIAKQERLVQIARIYHSAWLDVQRRKVYQPPAGRFLGKAGDRLEGLSLTVTHVRIEDNPYKTQLRNGKPFFYVRQQLRLKDASGNRVALTVNARTASRHSCVPPSTEHAYRVGEAIKIASARVSRTYMVGNTPYTRLNYVKFE